MCSPNELKIGSNDPRGSELENDLAGRLSQRKTLVMSCVDVGWEELLTHQIHSTASLQMRVVLKNAGWPLAKSFHGVHKIFTDYNLQHFTKTTVNIFSDTLG